MRVQLADTIPLRPPMCGPVRMRGTCIFQPLCARRRLSKAPTSSSLSNTWDTVTGAMPPTACWKGGQKARSTCFHWDCPAASRGESHRVVSHWFNPQQSCCAQPAGQPPQGSRLARRTKPKTKASGPKRPQRPRPRVFSQAMPPVPPSDTAPARTAARMQPDLTSHTSPTSQWSEVKAAPAPAHPRCRPAAPPCCW